jgi:hypothetical protein
MRWRDDEGVRWRIRQTRLAWPRAVKPEVAFDLIPGGLPSGDDPISGTIGLIFAAPGLIVLALLLPFWLAELAVRLALTPVVALLRAVGAIPYRLELRRNSQTKGVYCPAGRRRRRETRTALRAGRPADLRLIDAPDGLLQRWGLRAGDVWWAA